MQVKLVILNASDTHVAYSCKRYHLSHVTSRHNNNITQNSAWFQASATKQMRTGFFWVITQRVVVISYRRFGTNYWSHVSLFWILDPV